jgi:hypothetical protein
VQADLSTNVEHSTRTFEALQASLVSTALAQREARQRFRQNLTRYLELCQILLDIGGSLVKENSTVESIGQAIASIETQGARLRVLVSLRPMALKKNRDLAAYWSTDLEDRCRTMIRSLGEGVATLRKYESAKRAIGEKVIELRLQVLDAVEAIGTEEEQRSTWEYLRRVLDEDRLSARKLFPE